MSDRVYDAAELARHTTPDSLWVALRGDVYDLTGWLPLHPGGRAPLLRVAGRDATRAFDAVGHSARATTLLATYRIGRVSAETAAALSAASLRPASSTPPTTKASTPAATASAASAATAAAVAADEAAATLKLSTTSHDVESHHDAAVRAMRTVSGVAWSLVLLWAGVWYMALGARHPRVFVIFPAYYAWATFAFWVWHRLAHTAWFLGGRTRDVHMGHHKKPFLFYRWANTKPADDNGAKPVAVDAAADPHASVAARVVSELDEQRMVKKPGAPSAKRTAWEETVRDLCHFGPLNVMLAASLAAGYALGCSVSTLVGAAALLYAHKRWSFFVHNAVHCDAHPWERFFWFQVLRSLHIVHHHGVWTDNFTTGENYIIDDVLGTTGWYTHAQPAATATPATPPATPPAAGAATASASKSPSRSAAARGRWHRAANAVVVTRALKLAAHTSEHTQLAAAALQMGL